jgi:hypothetical protein
MAPEQAEGRSRDVGPAADVYALGAILYELLTGQPPFHGGTVLETLELVRHSEPRSPLALRPDLPRDLVTVCLRALAKEPGRRFASAAALADDLGRFGAGRPVVARPMGGLARAWRWARRNRGWAAALASTAALLVVIAAGSTAAALLFAAERDHAQAAETLATERRLEAEMSLRRAEAAERDLTLELHLRAAFTPDGRRLIVSRQEEYTFYDVQTWEVVGRTRRDVSGYPGPIAFSRDGTFSVLATEPAVLALQELATGRTVVRLEDPFGDRPTWVVVSPDGTKLAVTVFHNRCAHVWDLRLLRQGLRELGLDWD